MTDISAALAEAVPLLAESGIETPRFDAQLLLAWTLKATREDLAREPERLLTEREQIIYQKAVALRTARRPLPYITGEAWFYGRPFKINRAVLIPRPETEELVSAALEKSVGLADLTLADIGTGSGCLAVTLALERPDAQVWATDLSGDALKLAHKNVVRHGFRRPPGARARRPARVLCRLKCALTSLSPTRPISTEADVLTLQPEVRDYEPHLALSGDSGAAGADGADLHRRLLREAPAYLKPTAAGCCSKSGRARPNPSPHSPKLSAIRTSRFASICPASGVLFWPKLPRIKRCSVASGLLTMVT